MLVAGRQRFLALARHYRRSLNARGAARRSQRLEPQLRADPGAGALVLSPHWDDAVLSCWGELTRAGGLTVVNVFAAIPPPGERGVWEKAARVADSAERARLRMAEDARALAIAGRTAVNLPLAEAGHRGRGGADGPADIDRALADAGVDAAARVYAPAGIGGHRDHMLVRAYALRALAGGVPVTLYADVPYCFTHGWPAWVDGQEPSPRRDVDAYWHAFSAGVLEPEALRAGEVLRLDAGALERKCAAVACYEASLGYGMRRLLCDPAFGGYEVRWPLDRAAVHAATAAEDERAAPGGP